MGFRLDRASEAADRFGGRNGLQGVLGLLASGFENFFFSGGGRDYFERAGRMSRALGLEWFEILDLEGARCWRFEVFCKLCKVLRVL